MGEAKQRAVHGGYFGDAAPAAFVRAWLAAAAEPDCYLDLASGMAGDTPVAVLTLGAFSAALTPVQARSVATGFEQYLGHAELDELQGRLADVILVLRQAADDVDAAHPVIRPGLEAAALPGLGG